VTEGASLEQLADFIKTRPQQEVVELIEKLVASRPDIAGALLEALKKMRK
jgi:hypothetical protein